MILSAPGSTRTGRGLKGTGRQCSKRPHQPARTSVLSLGTTSRHRLGAATLKPELCGHIHETGLAPLAASHNAALLGSHRLHKPLLHTVPLAAERRQQRQVACKVAAPDAVSTSEEGEEQLS
jgi:hypothetical protein